MIEAAYPYLILAGLTILAVLLRLRQQYRQLGRANLALVQLNRESGFDALALLRQAWPVLAAGGLEGFSWQADWFGCPLEGSHGRTSLSGRRETVAVGEMRVALCFHRSRSRGEKRYFDQCLEETFLLLLLTDLWIKAGSIDATFRQMSRLGLFLQHDMKNIAQFIQLTADQARCLAPGQEPLFLERLKAALPLVRQRADHIVTTLVAGGEPVHPSAPQALKGQIERLCALHGLDADIRGDASAMLPPRPLDTVLDNLLKNYADRAAGGDGPSRLRIAVDTAASEITLTDGRPVPGVALERLFEPFWSDGAAGLGIGLYQAREAARGLGGELSCTAGGSGEIIFRLWLPALSDPAVAIPVE